MSTLIRYGDIRCPTFLINPSGGRESNRESNEILKEYNSDEVLKEYKLYRTKAIIFGNNAYSSLIEVYNECSKENWDGYNAISVTEDTFYEAQKILDLLPSYFGMPDIFAEPSGAIAFEWRNGEKNIFVMSVDEKHAIYYAGIFGESKVHGTEYFEESLPMNIIENLRRVFL